MRVSSEAWAPLVAAASAAAALLGLAACQGSGGAASVRWRVVDLSTGALYDPHDHQAPGGVCECVANNVTGHGSDCANDYGWTIHAIRLIVADPMTGLEVAPADGRLNFSCTAREATTPFILPQGTFALSLEAFDPRQPALGLEGITPPPALRDIKKAEIVNLDVIEIGVHPLPHGPGAGGVPDGGAVVPDGDGGIEAGSPS